MYCHRLSVYKRLPHFPLLWLYLVYCLRCFHNAICILCLIYLPIYEHAFFRKWPKIILSQVHQKFPVCFLGLCYLTNLENKGGKKGNCISYDKVPIFTILSIGKSFNEANIKKEDGSPPSGFGHPNTIGRPIVLLRVHCTTIEVLETLVLFHIYSYNVVSQTLHQVRMIDIFWKVFLLMIPHKKATKIKRAKSILQFQWNFQWLGFNNKNYSLHFWWPFAYK